MLKQGKNKVMKMVKKLYKCKKNKMIDGVCAGIAAYFNIDPTIVRLGAVLLACMDGRNHQRTPQGKGYDTKGTCR